MYLDRCRLLGIAVAVFSSTSQFAFGQSFPSRTITIIVPYPAGGPTDLIARTLGERVRQPLGQSVIVENVTGAGGTIGVGRATRATPDGHTLLIGNNGSNVLNAALYSLPFDIMNDLAPVARLTTNPQIIISKSAIPAKSLVELIAWLKQNQANVSVGIAGPIAHVNVINFQNSTSTRFKIVPYRGANLAMQDLVGGHIELMLDQLSNALSQVRAGTVKAYAVAAPKRSPSAPDVPTVDEAGLPGLHGSLWHGLWVPKSTPQDIIATIASAIKQALADPVVRQKLGEAGQEVVSVDQQIPAALAGYQTAEAERWLPLVKAANLKGD